jgi:catechol 2,3-dioxygenase-like lactoylglutathione lyase family enzyme
MMFSRLDTLILRVRDLASARQWYAHALGLETVYVDEVEGLAVLGLEGTSLTLWQLKPAETLAPDVAGSYPIFGVADAEAAHERLRVRGVSVEEVQSGPGVRFFGFRDADGNRLEACQVLPG